MGVMDLLMMGMSMAAAGDSAVGPEHRDKAAAHPADTHLTEPPPPSGRAWLASAETAGANLVILAFDRYILDAPFARVTWQTVSRNLSPSRWYWDSDLFRTNLMQHPYHGSLYYNAARSNGLTYYESVPFAVGGSLMWEIAGEMEQPSFIDFASTSVGGLAIGEVTHRLAERVLNCPSRGARRVIREILGAAINPMGGITRMLKGDTFRSTGTAHGPTAGAQATPLECSLTWSGRFYGTGKPKRNRKWGSVVNLNVVYGSPVDDSNATPFDFFRANVGIDFLGGMSLVSNLNIIGQLKNWMLKETGSHAVSLGIYQNFDYHSTDSIQNSTPYKISEAASIGAGLASYCTKGKTRLFEELYINGVILGGALSDYRDNRYGRDYSVGSGYSVKSITGIDCNDRMRFRMTADLKHLFSWKGYEDEDNTKLYIEYSVMGDRGNIVTLSLKSSLEMILSKHWSIEASAFYVLRDFDYKYRQRVVSAAYDLRCGIRYRL